MIKINEIFHSIQGESSFSGLRTVFVRTSGCNLRCTYCDTTYAYYNGEKKTLDEIVGSVLEFSAKHVCVTGGEPLLQPEVHTLLTLLCDKGLTVSLETSGGISCSNVDRRVKKIIDVKTPDSGEGSSFCADNLMFADMSTEFKFVICSEADFDWSESFCLKNSLFEKSNVLYSPSFGKVDEQWLAKKIIEKKSSARLQLQLHKYIWSPHTRGV